MLDFFGWPERRMHPTQLTSQGVFRGKWMPVKSKRGSSRQLRSQQGHETGSQGRVGLIIIVPQVKHMMWNGALYNTPKNILRESPPPDFDDDNHANAHEGRPQPTSSSATSFLTPPANTYEYTTLIGNVKWGSSLVGGLL